MRVTGKPFGVNKRSALRRMLIVAILLPCPATDV